MSLCGLTQAVEVHITAGSDDAASIAIVPMGKDFTGAMPEDIAQIVEADLKRSGLFEPFNRLDMLGLPHSGPEIYFKDWRMLGVEYLVVGKVSQMGGSYQVTYELHEVFTAKRLWAEAVTTQANQFRDTAHYMADQIFEKITGIKGAFSTKLLYVVVKRSGKSASYELQVADADGYRPRTILKNKEPIVAPAWSPDAQSIAYMTYQKNRTVIYVQDLQTGTRRVVVNFKGTNTAPNWSPDGHTLAFASSKDGNTEIYTIDVATMVARRLTNHYAIDTEPSWSPEGRYLIFTSDRGGKPQLYRLTVATGEVQRMTFEGDYNACGAITPDNRRLVMVHRNRGEFHIAAQHLEQGTIAVLTDTALDESPSVAPNGSMVIYATHGGGRRILSTVSMNGRARIALPPLDGDMKDPAWSPFLR